MSFKSCVGRMLAPLIYRNGWCVVPAKRNYSWPQHKYMKMTFDKIGVDCVLDVGGNAGQYGRELRLIGYKGLIISFEPDQIAFNRLEDAASKDGRWFVRNIALGSTFGPADFNIMESSLFNSFRTPTADFTTSVKELNNIKKVVSVNVSTLNNELPELFDIYKFSRPFLKMDTQGFDVEVFKGADLYYDTLVGLQSELPIKPIYAELEKWTDTIDIYSSRGFELTRIFAVNPYASELVEVDCFMLRKNLLKMS